MIYSANSGRKRQGCCLISNVVRLQILNSSSNVSPRSQGRSRIERYNSARNTATAYSASIVKLERRGGRRTEIGRYSGCIAIDGDLFRQRGCRGRSVIGYSVISRNRP